MWCQEENRRWRVKQGPKREGRTDSTTDGRRYSDLNAVCLSILLSLSLSVHNIWCLGEKLSKQELQSNGIIKKLRSKERQNDQLLAAQRFE